MTHTTDSIQNAIISKALTAEQRRIEEAITRFKDELGTDIDSILVTSPNGNVTIGLYFSEMVSAILEERTERISSTAVAKFLSDYDAFCATKERQS